MILVIGIKESANANNAMVLLKIGIILFFIAVGAFLIRPHELDESGDRRLRAERLRGHQRRARRSSSSPTSDSTPSRPPPRRRRTPRRDMPFGIIMSLLICTVLYIAIADRDDGHRALEAARHGRADDHGACSSRTVRRRCSTFSRFIIALGAVIAMGSVLLVFQLGQPRIFFSMSRDGLLPPCAAPRSTRSTGRRTSGRSSPACSSRSFAAFANIAEVVDLTNIGTLFAFVLVSAGVIVLRRTDPDRRRPFRVPWVPITPLISIVACLYLMFQLPGLTWIRFASGW